MSSLLQEHVKGSVFIKRILVFSAFLLAMVSILLSRLFYLQILSFNELRSRSEDNRIRIDIIPPLRGDIFDRNDNRLTNNRVSYEVVLYRNKYSSARHIMDILSMTDEKRRRIMKRLKNGRDKQAISIMNNLTWNELVKISANGHRIGDFSIEEGYVREYLYGEEFAHVLGYVAVPDDKDIKRLSRKTRKGILLHPNFKIGKDGLEGSLNSKITGKSGYKKVEVNVHNIPIEEIDRREPERGEDIKLTIDLNLQRFTYNRVRNLRSAVVVLDVETGEILAMVSTPSFETNEFTDGISNDYWAGLLSDERKPMHNKTINALYAMGSTFKPIVSIAAMENDWNENKKVECTGVLKITKKLDFRCWKKKGGHGHIGIIEALESSCNIFFANLGVFAGIDSLHNVARQLGIGEKFEIDLPGYNSGLLPGPSWKREYYNESWTKGDTINLSIGQGYVLANPLQLAVMASRIANGGYPIRPFLIFNSPTREQNRNLFLKKSMFREKSIAITKTGMFNVVNGRHGTASWLRTKKHYQISGKTGTAQVVSLEMKEKMEKLLGDGEKLEEKYRDHGIFIGFAPFDKPKYGVAVVVEHGNSGSLSAAPVAIDILKFLLDNSSEKTPVEKSEVTR
ncbi:MAG: penicillin-binding protein 2 [Rickettsiales bacterium]|jgi:penicillin-binding protein 2|nr:penicillin-binding protein 2 [Rickettsiales bacterium]